MTLWERKENLKNFPSQSLFQKDRLLNLNEEKNNRRKPSMKIKKVNTPNKKYSPIFWFIILCVPLLNKKIKAEFWIYFYPQWARTERIKQTGRKRKMSNYGFLFDSGEDSNLYLPRDIRNNEKNDLALDYLPQNKSQRVNCGTFYGKSESVK